MMLLFLRAFAIVLLLASPALAAYSCFTKPNVADQAFSGQAKLWGQEFQILAEGLLQTGVVFSSATDCLVTAQATPNMSVAVNTGCTIAQHGVTAVVAAGNVTISAAHATLPRIDYVSANNVGTKIVTAGTPAATPTPPTIPQSGGFNNVVLAEVFVPAGDTAIGATQIIDKRACIPAPSGIVNVTAFGASPSESAATNTTKIQAAITAAETAGVPLLFPAGTGAYNVLTGFVLKRSTRIIGLPGATVKLAAASGTLFTFGSGVDATWAPGGIEGLTLQGNGGAADTSIGVQIGSGAASAHGVTLVGVDISAFGNGLVIAGAGDAFGWVVDRARIHGNAFNGIRLDTATTGFEAATISHSMIFNNGQSQATGAGIQVSASGGGTLRLLSCNVDNNGNGTLGQIHVPATGQLELTLVATHFEHAAGVDSSHIALLSAGGPRSLLNDHGSDFVQNPTTPTGKALIKFVAAEVYLTGTRFSIKAGASTTPAVDIGASVAGNAARFVSRNVLFGANGGTVANAQAVALTGTPSFTNLSMSGTLFDANFQTVTAVYSLPVGYAGDHDLVTPGSSLPNVGGPTGSLTLTHNLNLLRQAANSVIRSESNGAQAQFNWKNEVTEWQAYLGTGGTRLTFFNGGNGLALIPGTGTAAPLVSVPGSVEILPYNTGAGNTGELRLLELAANGTNYSGWKARDAIATNAMFLMPADGSVGQCLVTDGALGTSFASLQNIAGVATPAQLSSAVNAQTGVTYTIADGDRGKLVTHTNAGAIAVTLPQAGAGGAFIAGWYYDTQNRGAGTVTITPTTSTIDGAASLTLTIDQGVRIFSDGTNYYTQRGRASAGGGDASTNTATSVVDEVAVFADATGKLLKRATATGPAKLTSGVLSASAVDLSGAEATGTLAAARMPALTGDVTNTVGTVATTIANDAVTYAKMQNVSVASRLIGRGSAAGAGDPEEIIIGSGLSMTGTTLAATGGGTGTVTQVDTAAPITGGPITTTGTIGCATCGVTGTGLGQFAATSSATLAGVLSDETGTGLAVFATSPTLVTPVLGVATATSINKVALTAPLTGSTITVADGKTLTASNTLSLTGTDGASVAFGAGGTAAYTANTLGAFAATSSAQLAGVLSDETGSGAAVFATSPALVTPSLGVATATSVNKVTITPPATSATLTIADGKTWTVNNTATLGTLTDGKLCAYTAVGTSIDCTTTPAGGSTPTGTGFRHVTAGVEDAAAKLVDTADINAAQVTNAKLANMATATFKGRTTAGTGDPEDLTATQATAMLNLATTSAKGLAPVLSNVATQYLDGTGAYSTPAGSGPVSVLALTSDAATNSTTTGVEITGLNKTTGTGTFTFQYFVRYQSAAAGTGVAFGVNHTGTVTAFMATMRFSRAAGSASAHDQTGSILAMSSTSTRTRSTTAPNLGPTASVDSPDADMLMIIDGLVVVTVDGDLELWHASDTAAASTVKAGSSLILTKTN